MAELDANKEKTRGEVATYLREFADELDSGPGATTHDEKVTLVIDNESATVTPPATMQFAVEVETDSSMISTGTDRGVTFSLGWDEGDVNTAEGLDVE